MRHTFHLSFLSPTNVKRKYCFSFPDLDTHRRWGLALEKQIGQTQTRQKKSTSELRKAAEVVSLQVLRDAVIPPTTPQDINATNGRTRQGSVSTTYQHVEGKEEAELGPLQTSRVPVKADEATTGLVEIQTGKELVLLCRQNSLLPGLLELLTAGRENRTEVVKPVVASGRGYGQHGQHGRKASVAGRPF